MGFGGGGSPPPIPLPPPAAHPPTLGSSFIALSGQAQGDKSATSEGMGNDGTVGTSGQGSLTKPATAQATLLGG